MAFLLHMLTIMMLEKDDFRSVSERLSCSLRLGEKKRGDKDSTNDSHFRQLNLYVVMYYYISVLDYSICIVL